MTKFLIPTAALMALLIVTGTAASARDMGAGSTGGPGASSFTAGHEARVRGTHGASAKAPGRLFLRAGHHSLPGHPGASGFAPGHRFHHR
jgi:hypothetical protein